MNKDQTPMDGRQIETAPKDERLMLFFPAFGAWIASWWPGSWSWAREQWVIHSPFGNGDKAIMATDAPQPTHWMPHPPAPGEVEAARAQTAAEPEMWQWRFLQQSGQWSAWIECAEEYASRITALGDIETQVRCLYAAPSSAPAPSLPPLPEPVFRVESRLATPMGFSAKQMHEYARAALDAVAAPAPGVDAPSISDERILQLWDTHVGYETGLKGAHLNNKDKLAFARAVLTALRGVSGDADGEPCSHCGECEPWVGLCDRMGSLCGKAAAREHASAADGVPATAKTSDQLVTKE